VSLKTYDETIRMLRGALDRAKAGDSEKFERFARLDRLVRNIERRYGAEADFDAVVAHERAISKSLDGRSVFDDRREKKGQMGLFDSSSG